LTHKYVCSREERKKNSECKHKIARGSSLRNRAHAREEAKITFRYTSRSQVRIRTFSHSIFQSPLLDNHILLLTMKRVSKRTSNCRCINIFILFLFSLFSHHHGANTYMLYIKIAVCNFPPTFLRLHYRIYSRTGNCCLLWRVSERKGNYRF
jgi:hypothetical protein